MVIQAQYWWWIFINCNFTFISFNDLNLCWLYAQVRFVTAHSVIKRTCAHLFFKADWPAQVGDSCVWRGCRVSGYVLHVTYRGTTRSTSPRNMFTCLLATHRNCTITDCFLRWTLQVRIREWQCTKPVVWQGWMAPHCNPLQTSAPEPGTTHSVNSRLLHCNTSAAIGRLQPPTAQARTNSTITLRANGEIWYICITYRRYTKQNRRTSERSIQLPLTITHCG